MAEPTNTERELAAEVAAQARERGREQLEGAKGELADRADRVAAAVERAADELGRDGDGEVSGLGRSLANVMRQLAGGLREGEIDDFARELGELARRNPGMFLAGSVALGFGVARFFKARAPESRTSHQGSWRTGAMRSDIDDRYDFDADESLDLSANARDSAWHGEDEAGLDSGTAASPAAGAASTAASGAEPIGSSATDDSARPATAADDRSQSKRPGSKAKGKPQRASAPGEQPPGQDPSSSPLADRPTTGSGSSESAFTGGVGGAPMRGGKDS